MSSSGPTRTRSWTWFLGFQAAALIPVLLVGLALSGQYRQQRTAETLRDARTQALYIADLALGPALSTDDLSVVPVEETQRRVAAVIARPAVHDQVLRLKVWDRSGRVVASDSPQLVGRVFPLDDDVAEALEGQSHSDVTHLTAVENVEERRFGAAVEAYVPLHGVEPDRVVGVLEVYLPYEPLAADLRQGERTLLVHLALGLLAVVLALGVLTTIITARLRRRTDRTEHLVNHDELTGLLSRHAFERHLEDAVASGEPAAVLLADLDDLKRVNDALGHAAGDVLLQHAARVLVSTAHRAVVARLGGDEFAVLLPGVASTLDVQRELALVHAALAQEVVIDEVPVTAAASVGGVLFPDQSADANGLLQCAETALYAAKRRASGVALYSIDDEPFDAAALRLLSDLRRAVEGGQLVLDYQPQTRVSDGRTASVEALVRWQHPHLGRLAPDAFLPLAEHTGLITQITGWVLDEAARQVADWSDAGLDLVCSVNISARDLASPGLLGVAVQAVKRHGIATSQLCLELTETAILEDAGRAREVLTALSEAGFGLSLDDFGQGYTSLGQLRDLPVDELKLDRSFVAGLLRPPGSPEGLRNADRAVVQTVAQLAHRLGLRVVAEGVETQEQAAELVAEGYDFLQGWHVGRPAAPGQLLELQRQDAATTG